jgi:hypothetical protein
MNDRAIKTFAQMMKKTVKLSDGTMYNPLEHPEDKDNENFKPRKVEM